MPRVDVMKIVSILETEKEYIFPQSFSEIDLDIFCELININYCKRNPLSILERDGHRVFVFI